MQGKRGREEETNESKREGGREGGEGVRTEPAKICCTL